MRILINGLGLIGGSLAQALVKFTDHTVVGLDQNKDDLVLAKQSAVIDVVGESLAIEAPRADVIILATPVQVINQTLQQLATLPLKPGVIVTDTGSTKQTVLASAQGLQAKGITFIGGHPMAGSHKSGVQAANCDLFRSAFYLLVPAKEASITAVQTLQALLQVTNAKFLQVSPEKHDQLVALLSHVPHILAASLVNLASQDLRNDRGMLRLAAGGFRDMTRIASSDPEMWVDILDTNGPKILNLLYDYEKGLHQLEQLITTQDRAAIFDFFRQAKITREKIEADKQTGALPGFYDLHVDIPDKAGSIAQITTKLAQANINLVNIQILETRDEVNGVLQLTFANARDLQRAQQLLDIKKEVATWQD
ncbi:prephenate dehydrogenase [Agrilactobacillus fermenti]|uniref:prephenate dehydrogenase n=1 Tax=Agrilactobacillus fermenti TaxID=2586909 RepID=UPI001E3EE540|nr:prephenate dehydrogenase [Agrilactobacillus fermenti]MCD2255909.1 prephenate dehydrogenase [Agrilactobacillus fermenti]